MKGTVLTIVATLVAALSLHAQEPTVTVPPMSQEQEERLAAQPPEAQAYSRYRYWVSFQPSTTRLVSPELLERYRSYLVSQGLSATAAQEQIRLISEHGARLEFEGWNRTLTDENPIFDTNPNAFMVRMLTNRRPGRALDVGMGQGRNAIWLAQQGWDVTGYDPADKAVALANDLARKAGVKLHTVVATDDDFEFGDGRWDLIVMSYVNIRGNASRAVRGLRPGGLLLAEYFHRDSKTRPPGAFRDNEMVELFRELRILQYEDTAGIGDFGKQESRLVRILAEKRLPPTP